MLPEVVVAGQRGPCHWDWIQGMSHRSFSLLRVHQ